MGMRRLGTAGHETTEYGGYCCDIASFIVTFPVVLRITTSFVDYVKYIHAGIGHNIMNQEVIEHAGLRG